MKEETDLELRSLREQVYDHLRSRINRGRLRAGAQLDLKALSSQLGISRTPLRDALIQLEVEGFVRILPRKGVVVRALEIDDIRHLYEVVGALEGVALLGVADRLQEADLAHLRELNAGMKAAIDDREFDRYYALNLEFHEVFLGRSENEQLVHAVEVAKQRLYDFPRRHDFVPEWEVASIEEHARFLDLLEAGEAVAAADFLRDVHWSFEVQQTFIRRYYFDGNRGRW